MQKPPTTRRASPTSPAHLAAMYSHSGLWARRCPKISAMHASGPKSSNSRATCSRVDFATRGNALMSCYLNAAHRGSAEIDLAWHVLAGLHTGYLKGFDPGLGE